MYTTYSICFHNDTKQVEVKQITQDTPCEKVQIIGTSSMYNGYREMPEWIQRKVSVLRFVGVDQDVDGVGRMLNKDRFWIYDGRES